MAVTNPPADSGHETSTRSAQASPRPAARRYKRKVASLPASTIDLAEGHQKMAQKEGKTPDLAKAFAPVRASLTSGASAGTAKSAKTKTSSDAGTLTTSPVPKKALAQARAVKREPPSTAIKAPKPNTTEKATKPLESQKPQRPEKAEKPKKPKLIRDSFTIPKVEYMVLDELKHRANTLIRPAKKSELLRAGIKALAALSDASFLAALAQVPAIKTGRPGAGD